MSVLRIAYAAILAAVAGAVASFAVMVAYGVMSDLHTGRPRVFDPEDLARTLAVLVAIGVPVALPLTITAAVVALLIHRAGTDAAAPDDERYSMRTRFLLGCVAAGAIWEGATWLLVMGEVRARLVGMGGVLGLAAGAAGGWVLWRWSQREVVSRHWTP